MHRSPYLVFARAALVTLAAAALAACATTGGAPWTYAPLGPTPTGGAVASPAGTPAGLVLDIATTDANPLGYEPNPLSAPPDTLVTVRYNNNNALEHNINFFNGPDQNAPSLGATPPVFGPNNVQQVTFTTPASPGDYFFWCDVHTTTMIGTLRIAQ